MIINTADRFGGGEVYTLKLYKCLLDHGFDATMLVAKDSWLEKELHSLKHSFFTYPFYCTKITKNLSHLISYLFIFGFAKQLSKICKEHHIDLIHCNGAREVTPAKYIAKETPIRVVVTKHVPNPFPSLILKNLDGLIGVSSQITEEIKEKNREQRFNIKYIKRIPPFFDEERFLSFTPPKETKKEFFKKQFNIEIGNEPLLCTIGNMSGHKSPHLLIEALHKLIHEKNKRVKLVFAGRIMKSVQTLAKKLNVYSYILFLGFVSPLLIPSLLFFSDIFVLNSKKEGLGITALEASLMKKALIGASGTGVADVIIDNHTGLVIENDNEQDLANAIEKMLSNPSLMEKLGENAYQHVTTNFSTHVKINQLIRFYDQVLKN